MEFVVDTLDYIQLYHDELNEFHQLTDDVCQQLNEFESNLSEKTDAELKILHQTMDNFNQKAQFALQVPNENEMEKLIESINQRYQTLISRVETPVESKKVAENFTVVRKRVQIK